MFTFDCRAARAAWWGLVVLVGLVGLVGLSQRCAAQFSTTLFDIEIETADSPRLRLHQFDQVGGVKPEYIWDLAGNEAGFTLTDVRRTRTPFTVSANTPTDTLYLSNLGLGHVGVGTNQPQFVALPGGVPSVGGRNLTLHSSVGPARSIVKGQTAAESFLVHLGGAIGQKIVRYRITDGTYFLSTVPDTGVGFIEPYIFAVKLSTGNVGIRTGSPMFPLQVGDSGKADGNGAHVTPGGVWTNASSRTIKRDIEPITSEQARETIRALNPVGYRYMNEPEEQYVGFIAEDVPDLVATNNRKSLAPMDIVAVLTKVVQDQDRLIERQQAAMDALNRRLTDLERQSRGAAQDSPAGRVESR